MTALVLDRPTGTEHTPASGTNDRRRELRDRGHQLRAARRRSTLSGLKHASARPACRSHARRAVEATSSQVRSGVYDDSAGGDGGLSCLANGERVPISEVREGDYVYATDPETGETGGREVLATLPHTDQLLTLKTSSGEIVTTEDHRYWNATDGAWQESQHLDAGDQLLSADGDVVTVEGLDWSTVHTDDAYDLTIAEFHSFYVGAGDESVLVHNNGFDCGDLPGLLPTAPKPLGLGSTGRTVPNSIKEQMAMTAARNNPAGTPLTRIVMNDARWPAADGWMKMSQVEGGVDIHYVVNTVTGAVDDFKFAV